MMEKTFVKPQELLRNSFELAKQIYDAGYHPDILIALWRGGSPVGMAVHEFFLYKGVSMYHMVLKTESYVSIEKKTDVRVEHAETLLDIIKDGDKVLVVDDIFDSGRTIKKLHDLLKSRTPHFKTATLYYKPDKNTTDLTPDFHVLKTDKWVVFPHELMDLTMDEIMMKDPSVHGLLL